MTLLTQYRMASLLVLCCHGVSSSNGQWIQLISNFNWCLLLIIIANDLCKNTQQKVLSDVNVEKKIRDIFLQSGVAFVCPYHCVLLF